MYLFLVNPEAGSRRFSRVEKQLTKLLDRREVKHRFVIIDNLANVPDLIKQHLRPTDKGVVAVGGNATVNAVINALAGEDTPIGIVPMSRTNHLAHSLGIKHLATAVNTLAEHDFRSERLGKIGQHYFVGEVEVAARASLLSQYLKRSNPWLKFLGMTPANPETSNGTPTTIELDDEVKVRGRAHRLKIAINDEKKDKKLKLMLFDSPDSNRKSVLHSDTVAVESVTKMPVMIGTETVAHTPVAIKGMTKYVQLIVPKAKELTATKIS